MAGVDAGRAQDGARMAADAMAVRDATSSALINGGARLPAAPTGGQGGGHIRAECRHLLLLALPLIAGQLSTVGLNLIDVVLAGHLGAHVLAAVAIGSSVWAIGMTAINGVLMALAASVAQLHGGGRRAESWSLYRQALWLAAGLGTVVAGTLWFVGPLLIQWMGVVPSIAHDATVFVRTVCWGAFPFAIYCACRGLSEGLSVTRPTAVLSIGGMFLLGPIAYVLMYGRLGLPALGAQGSAIALVTVLSLQAAIYATILFRFPAYADTGRASPAVAGAHRPRAEPLLGLLRIGVPMSVTLLMEAGLFIAISLSVGGLGETTAAAHQIALSVATTVFMVPLGLSMAITVRVGNAAGRGDGAGVRRAGLTGIGMALAVQMVSASAMLLLPHLIVGLYTRDVAVSAAAVGLLQLAGLFQLSDGIQVSSNGALRGLKDTRLPMFITVAAYWIVGMPLGWHLAFARHMGAAGLWIGLIAGLSAAAVALGSRFIVLCRRPVAASAPARHEAA
ncbi:multidrug resistance protein, MATE family [Chitinasiproducens palmae]|uniref:Multidrug-efflux transporter n=2 Tax=Chitinasiproducens palmae TaxID=1770053 RepID=A0A1H2PRX6_9BURK|nr:multidrug resistance protein, MATE family [Chitinasiproducens palmae]